MLLSSFLLLFLLKITESVQQPLLWKHRWWYYIKNCYIYTTIEPDYGRQFFVTWWAKGSRKNNSFLETIIFTRYRLMCRQHLRDENLKNVILKLIFMLAVFPFSHWFHKSSPHVILWVIVYKNRKKSCFDCFECKY